MQSHKQGTASQEQSHGYQQRSVVKPPGNVIFKLSMDKLEMLCVKTTCCFFSKPINFYCAVKQQTRQKSNYIESGVDLHWELIHFPRPQCLYMHPVTRDTCIQTLRCRLPDASARCTPSRASLLGKKDGKKELKIA